MDSKVTCLNEMSQDTMVSRLGIEFTGWDNNELVATMPVDERTIQPMKILHGGAMLALAETLGSAASRLYVDNPGKKVYGVSVAANHVKAVKSGQVRGVASLVHGGKTTQVWNVNIYNEDDNLISTARVTNLIMNS